jgi:hypothetical protein
VRQHRTGMLRTREQFARRDAWSAPCDSVHPRSRGPHSNCAPDIEELVQGQRVQFDEQISKRSGKPEAIAVELL